MPKWINTKKTMHHNGKKYVIFCKEDDSNDQRIRNYKMIKGVKKAIYVKIDKFNKRGGDVSLGTIAAAYPIVAIFVWIVAYYVCKSSGKNSCGLNSFAFGLFWPVSLIFAIFSTPSFGGGDPQGLAQGNAIQGPTDTDIIGIQNFLTDLRKFAILFIYNAPPEILLERLALLHAIYICANLGEKAKASTLCMHLVINQQKPISMPINWDLPTKVSLPTEDKMWIYSFNKWQMFLGITKDGPHNDIAMSKIPQIYGENAEFANKPAKVNKYKNEISSFYNKLPAYMGTMFDYVSNPQKISKLYTSPTGQQLLKQKGELDGDVSEVKDELLKKN